MAEVRAPSMPSPPSDPDFRYELIVDPDGDYIAANITPEDSPLVAAIQESIRAVTGKEPEYFVAWAGATDGRFYRQAGIDTVGYGPNGETPTAPTSASTSMISSPRPRSTSATITKLLGVS